MPTREEIDLKYIGLHDQLEAEFFDFSESGRSMKARKTLEEFNLRHGELWRGHEAELVASGLMEPRQPPQLLPDWKAQWAAAATMAEKLKVLARRLGLEA
jgi:N-methylhydantoinase B/oxoprolinase/acetone carboxylase alpha subunit